MTVLDPMLIRQLKKSAVLPSEDLRVYLDWINTLDTLPEKVPEHIPIPDQWHRMVLLTNQTYFQFNRDIALRARSLQLVSDEMVQAHELQRAELERQQLLIDAMKKASYQLSGEETEIHTPEDAVQVLDKASRQMTFYTNQLETLQKALDVHTVLIQCTANFTITTGNDNCKAVLGWGTYIPENITFFDIMLIPLEQIAVIRECISEGSVWQGELPTKATSTPTYWWQLSIVPAFNHEGALDRIIIASVDISKQKSTQVQVQQQKDFVDTLLASIPLPIYVKDLQGNYIQTNDAFEHMFGLRPVRNPLMDVELPTSHPLRIFEEKAQSLDNTREQLWELECRDSKNKDMFLKVNTQVVVDAGKKPQGSIGVISDISTFKIAEQTMRDSVEAAQSASRMKGEFLANMSHEIRTPLNGVIGLNELAMDMSTDELQRDYLKTAHTSAIALLGILNDILDLSKIEAGKIDLEHQAIEPEQFIWNLVNEHSIAAGKKNLSIYVDIDENTPSLIYGDALRLRQVLSNLLSNAIKFTMSGYILCTCQEVYEHNKKTLKLSVEDTGQGIDASKVDSVFDPFTQEDNTITRRYGGTGLGLTISRKLIHAMGGSLEVQSEKNVGSIFIIKLPLRINEIEYTPAWDVKNLKFKNIILIEDNPIAKRIIQNQLCASKAQSMAFTSQEEILEIMAGDISKFDLVMLNSQYLDSILWKDIQNNIAIPYLIYGPKPIMHMTGNFIRAPFSISTLRSAISIPINTQLISIVPNNTELTINTVVSASEGTILVVEDYPVNQILIKALLKKWNFNIELANDGLEALHCLNTRDYSLVLMDCQMPIMDGFEATRIIRASNSKYRNISIIAMTANALTGDKQRCLDAGMNDYISKPLDPLKLRALINTYNYDTQVPESTMIEFDATLGATVHSTPIVSFGTLDSTINYTTALDATDQEILHLIGQSFLDTLPAQCQMINLHIQNRNAKLLLNVFHALKGLFLTLYIEDIGAKLSDLEQLSNTIDTSPFLEDAYQDRLYQQIQKEWTLLQGKVQIFEQDLIAKLVCSTISSKP